MGASTNASSAGGLLRTITAHYGPSTARSLAMACWAAGLMLGTVGTAQVWAADKPASPTSAPAEATKEPAPEPGGAPADKSASPTNPPAPAATEAASPASAPTPSTAAPAAPTSNLSAPASEFSDLDKRIEDAKSQVIELNRDLMVLEEELLFPASTQVAIFVSMDVGTLFELDSVQVKLDDKEVANYLYTPGEVQALHRGGVQRVYLGNLRAGSHELVAFFTGGGPHRRDYRRATTVKFDKGTDPKYIELRIKDSTGKMQPEFDVRIWPGPNSPAPSASE